MGLLSVLLFVFFAFNDALDLLHQIVRARRFFQNRDFRVVTRDDPQLCGNGTD